MIRIKVVFAAFFSLTLLAPFCFAEVKLLIRADGKKVIYNTGQVVGKGRTADLAWLARQRDRSTRFDEIIERNASRFGLDPVMVKAVIQVESDFNPLCVSRKGARGLMQLMPGTAKRFKVAKIDDPEENIRAGVEYLSVLRRLFPNDPIRMLAAYNAGENAVARYRGVPPYEETRSYVQKALTVYYGRPYGGEIAVAPASSRIASRHLLTGGFQRVTAAPRVRPAGSIASLAVTTPPAANLRLR